LTATLFPSSSIAILPSSSSLLDNRKKQAKEHQDSPENAVQLSS